MFRPITISELKTIKLPIPASLYKKPEDYHSRTFFRHISITTRLFSNSAAGSRIELRGDCRTPFSIFGRFFTQFLSNQMGRELKRIAGKFYLDTLIKHRFSEENDEIHFPSLSDLNFRKPGMSFRKNIFSILKREKKWERDATEPITGKIGPTLSLRRILYIPFEVEKEELFRILPPPFLMIPESNRPDLYLQIALDATKSRNNGLILRPGREKRLLFKFLAPAMIITENCRRIGWIPIFSTSIPLNRPRFPGDPFRGNYHFSKNGIRVGLRSRDNKVIWEGRFIPRHTFTSGNTLPAIINDNRFIFIQNRNDFHIRIIKEELNYPVNRIHHMRYISPEFLRGEPELENYIVPFFSGRFHIKMKQAGHAFFLSSLEIKSESESISPWRAQYRIKGEATAGIRD